MNIHKVFLPLILILVLLTASWVGSQHSGIQSSNPAKTVSLPGAEPNSKCPGGFPACDLVKVTRVIDGDTFVTNTSERVRLVGVDTPETVKPNTPAQCYGKEASSFSKKTLSGREVWLTYKADEHTDKYGRTLAYVWLDVEGEGKLDLFDLVLIEQGYGRAYTRFLFEFKNEFVEAKSRAKEAKSGLWGACTT